MCEKVEVKEEKTRFDGVKVEVLGPTYEPGKPAGQEEGSWRRKLHDREEMLKYLKTGERYWYSGDWYGSERRKNPA
ncbi:MAG: hypothetical protein AB1503_07510 [Bacillota bacterium]|nr:hypothetical protein [Bacillota bacterium]